MRALNLGWCEICAGWTIFVELGTWLRDDYRCVRCRSIPRWRLAARLLRQSFPHWRTLDIYEPAPGGALSTKLRRECVGYRSTHLTTGDAEDLEALTFPDASFDIVLTQDVMEHVVDPAAAFREIARVLRPGGAHIFTTPTHEAETIVRARRSPAGDIEHLLPPMYHADPSVGTMGALVVTDWGSDLCRLVTTWSGLTTEVLTCHDRRLGLDGKFLEVFITNKPKEAPPRPI